jgi:DUF2950 family protein
MKTIHFSHFHRMKTIHRFFQLFVVVISASAATPLVLAKDTSDTGRTFRSPEEAVNALGIAANDRDTNALAEIFGPGIKDIRSSDPVEVKREVTAFAGQFNVSNCLDRVDDDCPHQRRLVFRYRGRQG